MKTSKSGWFGLQLVRATVKDADLYIMVSNSVASRTYIALTKREAVLDEIRRTKVFIIRYDGLVAGLISYRKLSSTHAYISELAIIPDFQGQGLGSRAFQFLLHTLNLDGFTRFTLHTHPENKNALKVYRDEGFEVVDRIPDFMGSGSERLKLLLLLDRPIIKPANPD